MKADDTIQWKRLTVGLRNIRVLLGAADRPISPQIIVEASVGVELVLGKSCTGNGKSRRSHGGWVPQDGFVNRSWLILQEIKYFQFRQNIGFCVVQSAVNDAWPAEHIPKSLLGRFTNTNCQDIYRRLVDIEPHPLGSISGFALAGGSEDVLGHGRGEVGRCWSYLVVGRVRGFHYECE